MADFENVSPEMHGYEWIVPTSFEMPPDSRGDILPYRFPSDETTLIYSGKGTMRGNHWHREQTQQLLLARGRFISLSQPLDDPEVPIQGRLIEEGIGMLVTPPRIVHVSIFLEDTVLLNLVKGTRDFATYDEHTERHDIVMPDEAAAYAARYGVEL
jgi:dTDP-4-dehydrorhamnose 3,5-epimerase-like enzyme